MNKKQKIKSLVKKGYTYKRIGLLFGITKQRVHQILFGNCKKKPQPITVIPKEWKAKDITGIKVKYDYRLGGRCLLAERVRKRDNWICQICGKEWKEGQRRFDVHHLDESCENIKTCENYKNFNRMITLCHKCHLRLDIIRKKFHKELST